VNLLRKLNRVRLAEIALILIVSALAYLPNIAQSTYYRDDWYYMLDRTKGGPATFPSMFSVDRPTRGPVFEAYYNLFGDQPLPYQVSAYAWRVMSGLAALWLFRLLWPRQKWAAPLGALLFTLYPGYLLWFDGIEYQPMIISVALEVISIAMTVQAVRTSGRISRVAWAVGSILTGWAYITLVDYAVGMEAFRALCVGIVAIRGQNGTTVKAWLRRGWLALRAWAVFAIIPLGFWIWERYIFNSARSDTNLMAQLEIYHFNRLATAVSWLEHFIQSALNIGVLAWGTPFYQKFPDLFGMQLGQFAEGVGLAAGAAVCVILAVLYLDRVNWAEEKEDSAQTADANHFPWQAEAVWVGLLGVMAGVLPIVIANRFVNFDYYSHYALPASLAGTILIVGLVGYIHSRWARLGVMVVLVGVAVLTHFAVSSQAVQEEQIVQNFWWQVSWRAPGGIQAGTTLAAYYPGVNYGENTDVVEGPANFIYYPETSPVLPVHYSLSSLSMAPYMPRDVLSGKPNEDLTYRTHSLSMHYDRILAMSQPTGAACVHVFDGRWPRFSTDEPQPMLLIGRESKIDLVLPGGSSPIRPPVVQFGPEPAHGWCYYYQKEELALQAGDYQQVAALGKDAESLHLRPADPVEWMPFVQANAVLGDQAAFMLGANIITDTRYLKVEACTTLKAMQSQGTALSTTFDFEGVFCK